MKAKNRPFFDKKKLVISNFVISNSQSAFTLIELLVVITIIGILITLVTVAVVPIQRKSRDAKRKADVNSFLSGINLFKADLKIYPNSTFYLGSYGGSPSDTDNPPNPNSNYAVATDVEKCNAADVGATSAFLNKNGQSSLTIDAGKPTFTEMDTKPLLMTPGFEAVNNFLICLRYTDRLLADPKPASPNPQDKYQYRVSYDYGDAVVTSRLESENDTDASYMFTDTLAAFGGPPKRYYRGSGVVVRHLDDSSDVGDIDIQPSFDTLSGSNTDGSYLYQCKRKPDPVLTSTPISRDNRVSVEPIISVDGSWTANTACFNDPSGLDVVQAH